MQPNEAELALVRDYPDHVTLDEEGRVIIDDPVELQRLITRNTWEQYQAIANVPLVKRRDAAAEAAAKRKAARKQSAKSRRNNR